MQSRTDYRDLYGRLKDVPLPVSRETGALLYMLARGFGARTIVEFGTSFGISTLHLAAALRDNGGGRLITSEFEPSKVARARGKSDGRWPHRPGGDPGGRRPADAERRSPGNDRLVLLDGAKALYPDILNWWRADSGRALHRRRQCRSQPRLPGARAIR